jgi:hypothetical protein
MVIHGPANLQTECALLLQSAHLISARYREVAGEITASKARERAGGTN